MLCVVLVKNWSLIGSYNVLLRFLCRIHCLAFLVNAGMPQVLGLNFQFPALVVLIEIKRLNFYGNVQSMLLFGALAQQLIWDTIM